VPRSILPGSYLLLAGAYRPSPGGPVPLLTVDDALRVTLGTLQIEPSSLPPVTRREVSIPFGQQIALRGYDYDLSVPGRARLYLHWYGIAAEETTVDLALTLPDNRLLSADTLSWQMPGFFTTVYEVPDFEVVSGLRLALEQQGQPLWGNAAWNLPLLPEVALAGPVPGERYIMIGEVIVTGYGIKAASGTVSAVDVWLTMRSMAPVVQDVSIQLAAGSLARFNGTPVGGAIPTLKWNWGATVTDSIHLEWAVQQDTMPELALSLYDTFTGENWPVLDPKLAENGPFLILTP